jgi:hypothetical protein
MKTLTIPEKITGVLFVIFGLWWMVLYFYFHSLLTQQNLYWTAVYQLIALWGGIFGLFSSRRWGGYRSLMGRAVIYFSIGLLLQFFGESAFSYYTTILGVDIPYPSIADIGYFGSVIFYTLGIVSIVKVTGVGVRLRNLGGRVLTLLIPIVILIFSYALFLSSYTFDWSSPLRIFLDFGYPLGEALYVSIAVLALILSRNILGGVMKSPLTFLMMALVAQYFAEFNFLYQVANSTWTNGGYGDFLYTFAYFLMAISLVKIYRTLKQFETENVILP